MSLHVSVLVPFIKISICDQEFDIVGDDIGSTAQLDIPSETIIAGTEMNAACTVQRDPAWVIARSKCVKCWWPSYNLRSRRRSR